VQYRGLGDLVGKTCHWILYLVVMYFKPHFCMASSLEMACLSMCLSTAEVLVGDGMMGTGLLIMVPTVGMASPLAVPLSAGGAVLAGYGSMVIGKAMMGFNKDK